MCPFDLIFLFLFVSMVLGGEIPEPHAHQVDRFQQFSTNGTSNGGYWESAEFSGGFWIEDPGSFYCVTGTFTVPNVSGENGTGVYLWVGIDGITCPSAHLLTGITAVVSGNQNTYSVWSVWSPDGAHVLDLPISAGDVLKATVTAFNATSGVATIDNLTTRQSKSQNLASASPLCQQNAEWAVQVYQPNATSLLPTANFSTATIWDAGAYGNLNGSYGPEGANAVVLLDQSNKTVTSVTLNASFLSVTYL